MAATKERSSSRSYWTRLMNGAEGKDRSKANQKPNRKRKKNWRATK